MDRRAALTTIAAAWVAPAVLSSRVVALAPCSNPCAPQNVSDVTVSISVDIEPCGDGNPGSQPVFGTVELFGFTGAPCPCGPSDVSLVGFTPGVVEQLSPGPGNWDGTIPLLVRVTCEGYGSRTCRAVGDIGASGNCNALGGNTYVDETVLLDCLPVACDVG